MAAKTSPPPRDRSGVVGTGAPEELKLDGLLLQENKSKVRTKRGIQQKKNKKTTHRRMTSGASSSSSSSLSTKVAKAPAEKGQKHSVKDKNKKTKGQSVLICSPKSMLASTRVPGRVLDWRDFLAEHKPEEELLARPLFPTLRGPQGTGRGIYSTYTSRLVEETPGNIVAVRDLLVKDAPARLSPAPTMAGQSSRGIRSTKLRLNSYKKNKTTRQGRLSKKIDNSKRNTKSTRTKRKQLTVGGGFLALYSRTASGMTLTPFSIF